MSVDVEQLYDEIHSRAGTSINKSLDIVDQAFRQYRLDQLAFSFNGGKDCTVLLYLLVASLTKHRRSDESFKPGAITAVYFHRHDDEFPELLNFMHYITNKFGFSLKTCNRTYREGLFELVREYPNLKAVFMGVRRSDPYCENLSAFTPCDEGWPDLMRICPIIDLSYTDVWTFLKSFSLEYCSLYDAGFTSLGSMAETVPNPYLKTDFNGHKPAFMLEDGDQERAGRVPKGKL